MVGPALPPVAAPPPNPQELMHATVMGDESRVRVLLEDRADVAAADFTGWPALHWAAREGHEGIARRLLEARADLAAAEVELDAGPARGPRRRERVAPRRRTRPRVVPIAVACTHAGAATRGA